MDTIRELLRVNTDFQNFIIVLAFIGLLTILYLLVRFFWMICSGTIKLGATMVDKKQDLKIKAQEREIERLNAEVEKLQGISKEISDIKKRLK